MSPFSSLSWRGGVPLPHFWSWGSTGGIHFHQHPLSLSFWQQVVGRAASFQVLGWVWNSVSVFSVVKRIFWSPHSFLFCLTIQDLGKKELLSLLNSPLEDPSIPQRSQTGLCNSFHKFFLCWGSISSYLFWLNILFLNKDKSSKNFVST